MFATISSVISSASALSKVITLESFTEYKNLVLGTPDLATGTYITTDYIQIIQIHK